MEDMISITKKEYEKLKDKAFFLECLNAAGVDNWGGYGEAWELYEEDEEK